MLNYLRDMQKSSIDTQKSWQKKLTYIVEKTLKSDTETKKRRKRLIGIRIKENFMTLLI